MVATAECPPILILPVPSERPILMELNPAACMALNGVSPRHNVVPEHI